jgi:hypothetical protein
MKRKTTKLAKLEKNRYSVFNDSEDICYYCHRHKRADEKLDFHEVYGGSNRITSMKNGLCVHLCRKCHSNEFILNDLKVWCQREYERMGNSRAKFITLIGKSYI